MGLFIIKLFLSMYQNYCQITIRNLIIKLQLLSYLEKEIRKSMLDSQYALPKDQRSQELQNRKVMIPYAQLQTFLQNLIQDPIRPRIESFFLLNQNVDIQHKFYKCEQNLQESGFSTESSAAIIKEKNQSKILSTYQKRNIVFRLPGQHAQDKTTQISSESEISYFRISSHLMDYIILEKKSNETKKPQKQQLCKLEQFLYGQESIFLLIEGSLDLYRKLQWQQKIYSKANIISQASGHNATRADQCLTYAEMTNTNRRSIMDPENTSRFPKATQANQINGSIDKRQYKKHLEVKQNNFFTLINYRNINSQPHQVIANLKIIPKTHCVLARICVNPLFGLQHLKRQNKKLQLLSSLFLAQIKKQTRKSKVFRLIFDAFQEQKFKKDMTISFQGKQSQKIYILGNQGQVQITKKVYFRQINNAQGSKEVKICKVKGKSVFNAQFFLVNCKNLNKMIKSHTIDQKINVQGEQQFQDYQQNKQNFLVNKRQSISEAKSNEYNEGETSQYQDQLQVYRVKVQKNKYLATIFKKEKIYLGKNQNCCFEFLLPESNISNFTVKSDSAFATIYSINMERFQEIVPVKMKYRFIKNSQQAYLAYLGRSMQKLRQFQIKFSKDSQIKHKQIQQYSSLTQVQSGYRKSSSRQKITISLSKLQLHNKQPLRGLKNSRLSYKDSQILEKRVQMIKRSSQPKSNDKNLTSSFKQKIQTLILKNLGEINGVNGDLRSSEDRGYMVSALTKYYTDNLSQIFMQQRVQNKTAIFDKQAQILEQKYKRNLGQSQGFHNGIFLERDSFDPSKNKHIKISLLRKGHPSVIQNKNYLKGMQMGAYTERIKGDLSMKINETNKIKEQFLKIQSKCDKCNCYDDLQTYKNMGNYTSVQNRSLTQKQKHRHSSHDVKYHTMKIGVNWKTNHKNTKHKQTNAPYDQKPSHQKINQLVQEDEPFEKVYNRIRVLKQKSMEKFNFNQHLLRKSQSLKSRKQRKKSAPLLLSQDILSQQ